MTRIGGHDIICDFDIDGRLGLQGSGYGNSTFPLIGIANTLTYKIAPIARMVIKADLRVVSDVGAPPIDLGFVQETTFSRSYANYRAPTGRRKSYLVVLDQPAPDGDGNPWFSRDRESLRTFPRPSDIRGHGLAANPILSSATLSLSDGPRFLVPASLDGHALINAFTRKIFKTWLVAHHAGTYHALYRIDWEFYGGLCNTPALWKGDRFGMTVRLRSPVPNPANNVFVPVGGVVANTAVEQTKTNGHQVWDALWSVE